MERHPPEADSPTYGEYLSRPPYEVFVLLPVAALGALLASAYHGTIGDVGDLSPYRDLRLILRSAGLGYSDQDSPAAFPLLRDYPSVLAGAVAVFTYFLVIRQWQHFESVVTYSVRSGVIAEKDHNGNDIDVDGLIGRANQHFGTLGRYRGAVASASAILTLIIILGIQDVRIASSLQPPKEFLSETRTLEMWYEETHSSWWADVSNWWGLIVFSVITFAGVYLVIVQNCVGLIVARLVSKMAKASVFTFSALDPDGKYGWEGFQRAYRTVQISLSIHGFTLGVLVLVLFGPGQWQGIVLISVLILLWVVVAPMYTFVPRYRMRRSVERHRSEFLRALGGTAVAATVTSQLDTDPDNPPDLAAVVQKTSEVSTLAVFLGQIRRARIRPLGFSTRDVVGFVLFALPLVLTLIQTVLLFTNGDSGSE